MHTITPAEHDTIMAGLRSLQERILRRTLFGDLEAIATNGDTHPVLTPEQIDVLCMTINTENYQHG